MTRTSQSVISKHPGPSAEPACKLNASPNRIILLSLSDVIPSRVRSARRLAPTLLPDIRQGPQFRILLLPQFSKGGTHFFDKNGWLLKSRKVAALFGLVPVDEIGIGLLSPALWRAVYLSREDGCRDRQAELAS